MTVALATRPEGAVDIVAAIEAARALLDAGATDAALKLSSVAYDQAKATGDSAERVKASRDLVDRSRRMQAEALKIESYCYCAMADAVDAAQANGELARRGRPKNISGENVFTLSEVGLDAGKLHGARKIRDRVRDEPDFIEHVVEARLAEGLEPTRAAMKKASGHALGTKTATKDERGDDLYKTPIQAMRTLLALESFCLNVLEPSVGRGAILRPLEAAGYDVTISDFVDRGITTRHGEVQGVGDFCLSKACGEADLVTNPPFGIANAYAAHALREHKPRKMALLLNLNFVCGFEDPDRRFVMDENPPSRIYVFTRRLPMMHRDGWEGNKASSQMNTGWFVWERNEDGSYGCGYPQIIRVDWQDYMLAAPLLPGAGGHVSPLSFGPAEPDEFARTTPRKTDDERVDEEIARAIRWLKEMQPFDAVILRRAIAVRPRVAEALIVAMEGAGLIVKADDDFWRATAEGLHLTAQANAAAIVEQWRAGKAVTG